MCFRYELDVLELDPSEGLRAVRFRLGMHCDGCTVTVALLRMHCDGGIVTVALLRWHCYGGIVTVRWGRHCYEHCQNPTLIRRCEAIALSLSISLPLARALPPSKTT